MYKYELHCHTKEVSACAVDSAEDMIRQYHSLGYTGVVITDHFFNGNTRVPQNDPWEVKIEKFFLGYENAKKVGDRLGVQVFFGFEYSNMGNDFLTYGLDKEWLLNHPDIMKFSLPQYLKFVRNNGGFIIHAHPFRKAPYISMIKLLPEDVDAVETVNTSHMEKSFNDNATWYAKTYNLPSVCGSDAHRILSCLGGIKTPKKAESIYDLIEMIRNNQTVNIANE